jgi:hypothetical protein
VRAPFTHVDVPGRWYPYAQPPVVIEQHLVQQSLDRSQELAAMDDETLWQRLRSTADRLHKRLGDFRTGASWQTYLRLPEEVPSDFSLGSDVRRDALTKLLARFRYVATEPQYAKIAGLSTFADMQATLMELTSRLDASHSTGETPIEELPVPDPN